MKEFIEKLIEMLEGLRGVESDKCKEYANLNMGDFVEKYNHGEYCYKNAISIVNQLAKEYKPKTNADQIRSMSDEELAEYIFCVSIGNAPCVLCLEECDFCELPDEQCKEKTLQWLQSEAE